MDGEALKGYNLHRCIFCGALDTERPKTEAMICGKFGDVCARCIDICLLEIAKFEAKQDRPAREGREGGEVTAAERAFEEWWQKEWGHPDTTGTAALDWVSDNGRCWRAACAWQREVDAKLVAGWDRFEHPETLSPDNKHHCVHYEDCPSCEVCQKCIAAAIREGEK